MIKYHICFSFLFNSKKLTKKHPSVFSVILEGLRAPPCFWFTVKHHRGVYESPVHTQSIRISMLLSSIALIAVFIIHLIMKEIFFPLFTVLAASKHIRGSVPFNCSYPNACKLFCYANINLLFNLYSYLYFSVMLLFMSLQTT